MRWPLFAIMLAGCAPDAISPAGDLAEHPDRFADPPIGDHLTLTDEQWQARLTSDEYAVLRHEATELAFSGHWHDNHARGTYRCAGCGAPLFMSGYKFESGTGWPSFWQPVRDRVASRDDFAFGVHRTEVHCARCGGHLGHVFNDGPAPTGLRYCINSVSLDFDPEH